MVAGFYIAVVAGASLALVGALVQIARKSMPNNLKQPLETDWPVGFQLCFKLAGHAIHISFLLSTSR